MRKEDEFEKFEALIESPNQLNQMGVEQILPCDLKDAV